MTRNSGKKIVYGIKWTLFWIEAGFILAITHPNKLKREWWQTRQRHEEFKLKNRW